MAVSESRWLEEAARLARDGILRVEPNPPVGALVIDAAGDGRVIASGFHARYGGPHAEVVALAAAGEQARGATLVVTLEPCSTHGKTPPCIDAILAAGVRHVVVGEIDPNPVHAGRGLERLRAEGITVSGPFPSPCGSLLDRFRRSLARDRPHVIAKWAMSLDGKVATRTKASRWISGDASRARVHEFRGSVDGIAVGRGTVEDDDPELTARPPGPRRAARIAFDRGLTSARRWRALRDGGPPVIIVHGDQAAASQRADLVSFGVALVDAGAADSASFIERALAGLRGLGIHRLVVEGGPTLLGSFFDARLVDQILVFVAPRIIGGGLALTAVGGVGVTALGDAFDLEETRIDVVGGDVAIEGFVRGARDY